MKKYFLFIILMSAGHFSIGQTLESIKLLVQLTQYDKAKLEIDKFLSDPKNAAKAEAWYYKAYTYSNLARVANKTVADSRALNLEAYAAIKKYMELDSKAPLTKEENNTTLYNLYYTFYDLAAKMYNAQNYPESFDLFRDALQVHDHAFSAGLNGPNGLKFAAHDTDVVWNLAVLSVELRKKEEMIEYYRKIADADLGNEKYIDAYDELVKKYKKEGNSELFNKYVDKAKKHYPQETTYWDALKIEFSVKGLENEDLFKKYEELLLVFPNNYMVNYNYGHELDKYVYSADSKGKDVSAYKKKIPELYKKAISVTSTVDANLLLSNYYYNTYFDLIDESQKIKGTKPDDVKKRNELLALSKSSLMESIPSGEEAVKLFGALKEYKASDKVNYKQVLDILINAYKQKGDAAKAGEYEKKKAEVDKL